MTKSTFFVEEDKILAALFEEGMDNLHIQKPNSSPLYTERLLSLLPQEYYRKITVHDNYYLKQEYGLAGIHIDDPSIDNPKDYKGNISRSCTNLSMLKEIKKKCNYVFLHNIFDSHIDNALKSSFTPKDLDNASKDGLIDRKVYAMCGMNIDNIQYAKDLGFGGVVICNDLWNHFDIHNGIDYKDLISHYEKLRKAVG
jgi:thiamine-phosphate pyrophosphorylase